MAWNRFKGHKAALFCSAILGFLVLAVVLSPLTTRYGVNESVKAPPNSYLSPSKLAWLGTDDIGRDLYSRLIYGTRVSLLIGLSSAFISVFVGCVVGAVAGFRGGRFDDVIMRVTDLFLAFPFLVALLVVRNMFGSIKWLTFIIGDVSSLRFIIFLLAFFGWMGVARIVRGQVLALKEREFIEAARASGASRTYIIKRHLLPNSVGPIMVALTFSVVGAISGEATLSFFGYGPQPGAGATSLLNLAQEPLRLGCSSVRQRVPCKPVFGGSHSSHVLFWLLFHCASTSLATHCVMPLTHVWTQVSDV